MMSFKRPFCVLLDILDPIKRKKNSTRGFLPLPTMRSKGTIKKRVNIPHLATWIG